MSETRETNEPKRLYCACCGGVTRGRQFHNQDIGHGLCPSCGDWIAERNETRDCDDCRTDIERTYGKRGFHWDVEHSQDEDCTVNPETECCDVCGVGHGSPCFLCSGSGYHRPGCFEAFDPQDGPYPVADDYRR